MGIARPCQKMIFSIGIPSIQNSNKDGEKKENKTKTKIDTLILERGEQET